MFQKLVLKFVNDIQKKLWPRRNIIKIVKNDTKFTSQNTNNY